MIDKINDGGIRVRQAGRKSEYGPQPGQAFVHTAAFLIARADIDALLTHNDKLRAEVKALREAIKALLDAVDDQYDALPEWVTAAYHMAVNALGSAKPS